MNIQKLHRRLAKTYEELRSIQVLAIELRNTSSDEDKTLLRRVTNELDDATNSIRWALQDIEKNG